MQTQNLTFGGVQAFRALNTTPLGPCSPSTPLKPKLRPATKVSKCRKNAGGWELYTRKQKNI